MIFVAVVVAVASPGGQSPLALAVMTMQRCVRVTQCGLILFLLVFSRYLAFSWKQPSFGIASGFGLFATAELGANALFAGGQISEQTVGVVATLSYSCAILAWIGYALTKPLATKASGAPLVSQRWERSLTDLQHPAPADSLIPMFEGMVDRAFSKTSEERDSETFSTETFVRDASASQSFTGTLPLPKLHSLR
jgi:hypothetical protein